MFRLAQAWIYALSVKNYFDLILPKFFEVNFGFVLDFHLYLSQLDEFSVPHLHLFAGGFSNAHFQHLTMPEYNAIINMIGGLAAVPWLNDCVINDLSAGRFICVTNGGRGFVGNTSRVLQMRSQSLLLIFRKERIRSVGHLAGSSFSLTMKAKIFRSESASVDSKLGPC